MQKLPRTRLTLQKRTDTLRNLIRQRASQYQLCKAAIKVRDAQIQVLRARIGELSPALFTARYNKRIAVLNGKIELLQATSPTELLAEFHADLSGVE
jgi:hypothetical protein